MLKGKSAENKYQMDMCNGSILKKMLIFTVPLMFSSILQLLFNAADIVVVGKFAGDNSLAAVGSTSSLINLLVNLFIGLSIGGNVLAARYFGAKQDRDLSETVHTAMTVSVISGVVLAIVGILGSPIILTWMKTPEEVLDLAVIYLRIYFIGMPAMMVYNFGASILRAIGDTKRPLYFLMAAGVINVALNLIFVIVIRMDVAGVALATTISQCVSAYLVVRCLLREEGAIRLDLKKMHISKDKFLKILQIGLPAGFQGILFSLSNVVIQSSINSFGKIIVAGNSAAANLEGFVYVAMNSLYQGAISFTSQNIGAGKYERINKILFTALACVIVVGVVFGNAVVLFGEPLLGLYSDSEIVIEAGLLRLKYICGVYALCGMMDVMVGMLRGMGYSIVPMIVSLIGACALRIVFLTTVFKLEEFHKIENVYLTYPVSWILTFIAHVITFIIVKKRLNRRLKVA
ncbi:MAG: MATE family efflux transporter [Lachnospiraceae bacterium]|nr:MATE family efflux transporter [Lachnospiraceae bacterium]